MLIRQKVDRSVSFVLISTRIIQLFYECIQLHFICRTEFQISFQEVMQRVDNVKIARVFHSQAKAIRVPGDSQTSVF